MSGLLHSYPGQSDSNPASSSPVTFEERAAFPHLTAFQRGEDSAGGSNNTGPGGAPVVLTNTGSLVFPAQRSSSMTWLRRYRRRAEPTDHPALRRRIGPRGEPLSTSSFPDAKDGARHQRSMRRRTGRNRNRKGGRFEHEIDPSLLSSALPQLRTFSEFRHNVLFKPQRRALLRSQAEVQAAEKRRIAEREAARLANAPNEEDLTDFELLKVCLYEIRQKVEKLKVSGALDLRSFLGAKMGKEEFARLFRNQIGVKLQGRRLEVVLRHFDKDGDGNLDYIEIHSQLMNPSRLHVSEEEASHEDQLQSAMNKVREKVMEKQRLKHANGSDSASLINAATGGAKGKGPDLRAMFSHFDSDGSGVITRKEFIEVLIKLGVDMNRYELNQLYWTLDPDKSGKLSYAEFSRLFFDRRRRMREQQQKKKRGLLKPHWTPSGNSLSARQIVSKDRHGKYCSVGTPYKLEEKVKRQQDKERRAKVLYGQWKEDRSGNRGKEMLMTKSFLNAPHEKLIEAETAYIKERARHAKARVVRRHQNVVTKRSIVLKERAKLPPSIVTPLFGKWNTTNAVPVAILSQDVDDLNLGAMRFDEGVSSPFGPEEEENKHYRGGAEGEGGEEDIGELVDQLELF